MEITSQEQLRPMYPRMLELFGLILDYKATGAEKKEWDKIVSAYNKWKNDNNITTAVHRSNATD